jgi:hypothetical protein
MLAPFPPSFRLLLLILGRSLSPRKKEGEKERRKERRELTRTRHYVRAERERKGQRQREEFGLSRYLGYFKHVWHNIDIGHFMHAF